MSWLDKVEFSDVDVQQAINTQAIRTALEQNTSKITDAGFQSLLTSAPIPRLYIPTATAQSYGDGVETAAVWQNANTLIDSHRMFDSTVSTTNFTIPLDGFYTIHWELQFLVGNADRLCAAYVAVKSVTSAIYGAAAYLGINQIIFQGSGLGTVTGIAPSITCLRPFRAGDVFNVVASQNVGGAKNGGALPFGSPAVSVVWNAPYQNYTTQGGN